MNQRTGGGREGHLDIPKGNNFEWFYSQRFWSQMVIIPIFFIYPEGLLFRRFYPEGSSIEIKIFGIMTLWNKKKKKTFGTTTLSTNSNTCFEQMKERM